MGVTNVFARKELKYRLTASQDRFLREALAPYVRPDRYGESTICNIYYDTPDFRLIRKSIEKPVYKEKLRLRSYGPAGPDDNTFLELKKKYKGIVYKRRICLSERDAMNYLNGTSPLPEDSQIAKELDWFLASYGNLQPAVYLDYDRTAFYAKDDPDLRITFDRNIHFRTDDLSLQSLPGGRFVIRPGESIMEIKADGAMPLWLTALLTQANAQRTPFSKYGTAYNILLEESTQQSYRSGGILSA
ncbi:MAG: polyphosphate polymerase domain-containing protein [Clostridia bacterium]|nr:polyphosphate polymerase domain-containing protein [Clostridia bacterium]